MKYKLFFLPTLLIFNLIICNSTYAQENQYKYRSDYLTKFESFTIENGLSNNHVLDILQDKYGYIWIATRNGLNRFDGYRFVTYKNDPEDSTSLSDNYVTSLELDFQ